MRIGVQLWLFAAVFTMPHGFRPRVWLVAAVWVAGQWAFEAGLLLRVLRLLRLIRPASDRLAGIVGRAAAESGVPVRGVWEAESPLAQAAALPGARTLLFTSALLSELSDAEIEAVCRHELAHLAEPAATVLRFRLLSLLAPLPLVLMLPLVFRFGPGMALAPLLLGFLLIGLRVRLLRGMERRADRSAAAPDPAAYARALEKIYRINQMPVALGGLLRTHPSLYDRMMAAGVAPDYPRPAKPRRFHWTSLVFLALAAGCLALLVANG